MGMFLFFVTEALAIQKVLMRAIKDRYTMVIIESNSLIAVHAINRVFDPPKRHHILSSCN